MVKGRRFVLYIVDSPPSRVPSIFSEAEDESDVDDLLIGGTGAGGGGAGMIGGTGDGGGGAGMMDLGIGDTDGGGGAGIMGSSVGPSSSSLKFWYVDHHGRSVLHKDSAAVTFNGMLCP